MSGHFKMHTKSSRRENIQKKVQWNEKQLFSTFWKKDFQLLSL